MILYQGRRLEWISWGIQLTFLGHCRYRLCLHNLNQVICGTFVWGIPSDFVVKQFLEKYLNITLSGLHNVTTSFSLIHCELWGSYKASSSSGVNYFLTILDNYFRALWLFFIAEKMEVANIWKNLFTMVQTQSNEHVKIVRTDNDTEFTCLKSYFLENGILY